ncbi:isoleucine--tRNA ligase, mitochondrial [Culicoides brevitarsis]|uniref:isoleucine--tRNA ligase, mitochondrial n=1 Tax=Culicoides brevitarsis TaxID=469753 RepID=UPI00307BF864
MHRLRKIFSEKAPNTLYRYCTSSQKVKSKGNEAVKYTDTINLPKTRFPQRLNSQKMLEMQKIINETHLSPMYEWQRKNLSDPEFVLHDGPPYANGDTHIGHAVNKILKDLVMKSKIIERQRVHYVPGWDCHGLPIELKALSDSLSSPPMVVREKARKFALSTMEKQRQDFRDWGVGANWKKETYKTIDKSYVMKQIQLFYELYAKGLIFRDLKPVHWSASSKTALAEAELEYDPAFKSPSLYIRLKLETIPDALGDFKDIYAIIWTTTPWTLPSNQAVCYSPKLKYSVIEFEDDKNSKYLIASSLVEAFSKEVNKEIRVLREIDGAALSKCTYKHPVMQMDPLPFLSADHVQDSKGTGLVHTAPAHGLEDYLVCLANKIPTKCYVDELACYTKDAPTFLHGKSVLEDGNSLVLEHVKDNILFLSEMTHSYPIDWRTKKPVIFRASHQWFIDTEKIKEKAASEVEKVKLYPKGVSETHKSSLVSQLMKRPYWCISRQRCWGVPIPAFYDKNGQIIIEQSVINDILSHVNKDGNIDFWFTKSSEEILSEETQKSLNIDAKELVKGNDILDIWFDSGISWYTVLEEPKIADLYLEGVDQFTGWFQSSLMTSVALRDKAPYRSIFVHGFTVDEKGHKMSKSVGNVIAPKQIIKKYGIDTMRYWIAAHSVQHAMIPVSDKLLEGSAETVQKLRSTLRYMNGVLSKEVSTGNAANRTHLDRYILSLLHEFDENIQKLYESYQYNHVTSTINNFITNEISGVYLHLCKDRLYCGTDADFACIQNILEHAYKVSCKAMWPIVPFLVEESWSYYKNESFYKTPVKSDIAWKDEKVVETLKVAFDMKRSLYKHIKDVNTWLLDVEIAVPSNKLQEINKLQKESFSLDSELVEICQVSSISLKNSEKEDYEFKIKQKDGNLCPRCRRFFCETTVCKRCEEVLMKKQ